MRRLKLLLLVIFCLIPLTGYSIYFLKIDEKGNYYFACERSSGHTISIKIIDKNKYKVIGDTVGTVVVAESESQAALIACGEAGTTSKKTTE